MVKYNYIFFVFKFRVLFKFNCFWGVLERVLKEMRKVKVFGVYSQERGVQGGRRKGKIRGKQKIYVKIYKV